MCSHSPTSHIPGSAVPCRDSGPQRGPLPSRQGWRWTPGLCAEPDGQEETSPAGSAAFFPRGWWNKASELLAAALVSSPGKERELVAAGLGHECENVSEGGRALKAGKWSSEGCAELTLDWVGQKTKTWISSWALERGWPWPFGAGCHWLFSLPVCPVQAGQDMPGKEPTEGDEITMLRLPETSYTPFWSGSTTDHFSGVFPSPRSPPSWEG